MTYEKIKEMVLEQKDKGNLVFIGLNELMIANIKEFITQPVDGILYDLNRDEATSLTLMKDDLKRVNDFATALVIRELYEKLQQAEKHIKVLEADNKLLQQKANSHDEIMEDMLEQQLGDE